jgi:hypothetical protein
MSELLKRGGGVTVIEYFIFRKVLQILHRRKNGWVPVLITVVYGIIQVARTAMQIVKI